MCGMMSILIPFSPILCFFRAAKVGKKLNVWLFAAQNICAAQMGRPAKAKKNAENRVPDFQRF